MTLLGSDKVFSHHRIFSHHRVFPHFVDVKEGNKLIYTGFINLSLVTFKYMWTKCATMKLSITFIKKNNDFRDRYIESPLFQGTQQPPWWRSQSHFSCLRTWERVKKYMGYLLIEQPIRFTIFVLWWQSLPEWLEVWASFNVKGLKKILFEMGKLKFWAK